MISLVVDNFPWFSSGTSDCFIVTFHGKKQTMLIILIMFNTRLILHLSLFLVPKLHPYSEEEPCNTFEGKLLNMQLFNFT